MNIAAVKTYALCTAHRAYLSYTCVQIVMNPDHFHDCFTDSLFLAVSESGKFFSYAENGNQEGWSCCTCSGAVTQFGEASFTFSNIYLGSGIIPAGRCFRQCFLLFIQWQLSKNDCTEGQHAAKDFPDGQYLVQQQKSSYTCKDRFQ